MLNKSKRRLSAVLSIEVSEHTLVQRLCGRRVCTGCRTSYHLRYRKPDTPDRCDICTEPLYRREDDEYPVIRSRIKTYQGQIERIQQYYRDEGLLYTIDGEGSVEEVTERAIEALHHLF